MGYGYDSRCEVLGTNGILFAGGLQARAVTCATAAGVQSPIVASWRDLFVEAYLAEDEEFVRSIREGRPPEVRGEDGLRAVEIVNAGNESIRTGRPVSLS